MIGIPMLGSYVYVFETRSSSVQMNRFKMTRTSSRLLYHGVLCLINSTLFLTLYSIPEDQEKAKLYSLERYPCPTVEFFRNDVLVIVTDPQLVFIYSFIYAPGLIMFNILNILFHVICTVDHLYIVPPRTISIETRKKQQKFFIGILFQTIIPLSLLWFLITVLIVDGITHNVSQEIMNLVVVACAAHGLVESVAVLSVHQSYRMAVLRMVSRENYDSKFE
uniref:G protein-coupled receptor n=1 Tax=Caenorhabditis tropicalis TaxID=1561998 RepID=A0A1I7UTY5_9PELO